MPLHNAPYVPSAWGVVSPPPSAPVLVIGGTYVGNNLGQDLLQLLPVNWYWQRPLSGATLGGHWWSTLLTSHQGWQTGVSSDVMPQARMEDDASVNQRIAGADSQANASGVTYQFIAVSDPAARFVLNGAFAHHTGLISAVNPLEDGEFQPEAAFAWKETIAASTSITGYYRGPGHGASDASPFNTAQVIDVLSFGLGSLTSGVVLHGASFSEMHSGYSAWRSVDCHGASGMVQIGSYTGDGVSPRVIALTPATTNRFPLFALVVPHNGPSFFRDPSHTGVNSSNAASLANSTTAITAGGVDSITVGSTLNTAGVVYDVFVIPGGTVSWANGTFIPVPPLPACGAPWPPITFLDREGCLVTFPNGTDSGGGSGCLVTL